MNSLDIPCSVLGLPPSASHSAAKTEGFDAEAIRHDYLNRLAAAYAQTGGRMVYPVQRPSLAQAEGLAPGAAQQRLPKVLIWPLLAARPGRVR
ncbi:hypothetical protein [Nonomuraea zeae]|uniref:Uncharacterized protein n=1 Tax=Nonomuraea zeae TaxID=1642303 RepID=A0A5S4H390_9ACTN|nr:hypothetical protein [Nonomuraea zeae]TMR39597.1 hypothetical protein ETD85_00870 [Nonomuraea zeae]